MLNYSDLGTGEPLLMLHGLGQHKGAWVKQHELSNDYRLIIPDLTGHGQNELDDEPITLERMAFDVIKLLEEQLHIESVNICGLSLGGIIAQEVYRQRPDLCKSLILCNTAFYIPSFFANPIIRESERLFHKNKSKLIKHIVKRSIHNKNKKIIEQATESFYITDKYLECSRVALDYNYFPLLLRVDVPILLIGSIYDHTTPLVFNLVPMKWAIPDAKIAILNASHLSNIENAGEFNEIVRDFIG